MTEREARYRVKLERTGETDAFERVQEGIEGSGEAAEAAGPRLDRLGQALASGPEQASKKWLDFRAVLEEVDAEMAELIQTPGDLVDLGLARAQQDLEGFLDAVEQGKGEVPEMAQRARFSLDQLRETTAQLKSEGIGLTDTQERELEQLGNAYREIVDLQGEYRRRQLEVSAELNRSAAEAGDYRAGVTSLGDAFASLSPRMGATVAKLGTVTAGLTAGWQAGRGFMKLLGDIDYQLGTKLVPTINRGVRELLFMQEAMDFLAGATPSASEKAEEYNHILQQLRALGVEPVGQSLEAMRKQLETVRREQGEATRAARENTAAYEAWAEGLDLSREALREQAEELGSNLTRFFETAADDVDFVAVAERLQGPLSDLLANLRISGEELPAELADGVEQLFAQLERALRDRAGEIDPAAFEEAIRKPLEALLEAFSGAPEEVKAQLQLIAGAFGILPEAAEQAADGVEKQALRYQNAILEAAGLLERLEDGPEQLEALQQALESIDPVALDRQLAELTEAEAERLRGEVQRQIEAVRDLGGNYTENIQSLATILGILIPPWAEVTESTEGASQALEHHAETSERAGQAAKEATRQISDLGQASEQAGQQVNDAASGAEASAEGYEAAGERAKAGAAGLEEQRSAAQGNTEALEAGAAATERFDESQRKLVEGSETVASGLASSREDLQASADAWANLAQVVGASVTAIGGHLDTLGAKVSSLRGQVQGLAADFSALRDGDGAPSTAPAAGAAGGPGGPA